MFGRNSAAQHFISPAAGPILTCAQLWLMDGEQWDSCNSLWKGSNSGLCLTQDVPLQDTLWLENWACLSTWPSPPTAWKTDGWGGWSWRRQVAEQPGSPIQGGRRQILVPNVLGHPWPGNSEHAGQLPKGNVSLKSMLKDIGPRGCL